MSKSQFIDHSKEMLSKYIQFEIDNIKREKEDPKKWKSNEEYKSQTTIRFKEEE